MVTNKPYLSDTELPSRADLDALRGLTLLEFGTDWCEHCLAAKPLLEEALAQHPQWQYLKIEDGPGKALGRSYRVKLWPTLVLLQDGQEVGRLVRPARVQDLLVALSV
jgi:thioredoxin 1